MADDVARRALMETGSEDAVTVNQRALIDKILARYAAEFTVFRELLQNADDAGATYCQLHFDTSRTTPSTATGTSPASQEATSSAAQLPKFKAPLAKWTFKNDGASFSSSDWSRLRRIAEGNPDPDRIGAFGVGFYSLFSICEEPVVSSGEELMGFFWKGDSLFTRRAKNPAAATDFSPSGKAWTTFFMSLRSPSPLPESPLQLAQFLATSLTFTSNVRHIDLYFDSHLLCKLSKTLEDTRPLAVPSHLNAYSPEKVMRVERVESRGMKIDVDAMAILWESERERIRLEREKEKKPSLTAALTKSGGLTSMLQNAFGGGKTKDKSHVMLAPRADSQRESEEAQTARLLKRHPAKALLRVATSHIDVKADSAFKREIERSTKKPPPSKTTFNLIWVGKDEYDASHSASETAEATSGEIAKVTFTADAEVGPKTIFDGLMPNLNKLGNVFIGFRTHQTTGFAGHVAARFIPTVERESIDFIDRHCARWNTELLAIGGYTCRAVFEAELELLKKAWNDKADDIGKAIREHLLAKALHTMRFFTMKDSSPSPRVSATFLNCFFASSRQNILTLASTQGIRVSSSVRLPNAVLLEFVKRLPVIPPTHIEEASDFFNQVRSRNLVKDITMEDVFSELGSRALDVEEMVACLRWWINVSRHPGYDTRLRTRLLDSAVVSVSGGKEGQDTVQPLGSVSQVLNPQRVPADVPLPSTCLSYEVSKAFTVAELSAMYDWVELSIPTWLRHLSHMSSEAACPDETNLQLSPHFAEKVFGVVSRSWGNLSSKQQTETTEILSSMTCLPTKQGMRRPNQSYFANVSLFDDLAIVEFPTAQVKGNLEKVLVALGVRRHVELQLIFTRLLGGGDWSHVELLTYLASIRDSLSALEVDRLTKTPIWPKEGEVGPPGKEGKPKVIRYKASQLYEPTETLRGLGLPLMEWSSKGTAKPWRSGSDEAKFAAELGLLKNPPVETILALAASDDDAVRSKALAYFLDKAAYRETYKLASGKNFAFVPCRLAPTGEGKPGELSRLKPTDVYTNEAAQVMGFPVVFGISPTDVPKLQLRADPAPVTLISYLINDPPKTLDKAKQVFEYLATVQTSFSSHDISVLRSASIIPIVSTSKAGEKSSPQIKLVAPSSCYFGSNDTVEAFRSVFLYVPDLGPRANSFLRLIGVSSEPSIEEITTRLIADPTRFYNLCGSIEAYLGLLRQIASNWSRIKRPLRTAMKDSAFLLGSKRVKNGGPTSGNAPEAGRKATEKSLLDDEDGAEDEGEDAGMLVHSLKRPSEVVIFDDANAGMIFGSSLFSAPHEDLLEQGLYAELGSPKLSTLIEEKYMIAGRVLPDSKRSREVKALVLERTPLFLFECRQSGNKGEIRNDAEWLKSALEVVEVDGDGLRLHRILRFNGQVEQDIQKASAMAQQERSVTRTKVKLSIAGNMNIDWFEVAAALNKFLLSRQRLQEVLLFMTLLSTSLRDLKRRGFHVDKILQQRKPEREAYERSQMEQQRQAQLEALSKPPSDAQFKEWTQQASAMFPDADPEGIESALRRQKDDHLEKTIGLLSEGKYEKRRRATRGGGPAFVFNAMGGDDDEGAITPPGGPPSMDRTGSSSSSGGFFSSFKDRWRRPESSLASGTSSIVRPPGIAAAGRSANDQDVQGSLPAPSPAAAGGVGGNSKPPEQPSSLDSIRRNVLSAIAQSRPDASTSVRSESKTTNVKEANSTYCDNSGVETDLTLAGEVAGMRVYLGKDLDVGETMARNQGALERLISTIYRPVGAIFGLDPRSMHVFVDTKGPTIAFNRGGTIWLNLRFYLAWHDEDVRRGEVTDALISTFFSVAHEIAHNLEQQHNAQHEFYTSALCEQFFMSLANYIISVQSRHRAGGGGAGTGAIGN